MIINKITKYFNIFGNLYSIDNNNIKFWYTYSKILPYITFNRNNCFTYSEILSQLGITKQELLLQSSKLCSCYSLIATGI